MRNLFVVILFLSLSMSCKNDSKKEAVVEETIPMDSNTVKIGIAQLQGEFIYYADAAVLQTNNEVFGVLIDSMTQKLQDQVAVYKKEDTDMVPVTLKVNITEKPEGEEGWDYKIQILEILKIEPPKEENTTVIKLKNETK